MPNLTVSIREELKTEMDSMPDINWSEVVREFLSEKVKRAALLRKLDDMLKHSKLTEEDCLKLGEKMKEGMLKRYEAERG